MLPPRRFFGEALEQGLLVYQDFTLAFKVN